MTAYQDRLRVVNQQLRGSGYQIAGTTGGVHVYSEDGLYLFWAGSIDKALARIYRRNDATAGPHTGR
jgi:hypothetical protein